MSWRRPESLRVPFQPEDGRVSLSPRLRKLRLCVPSGCMQMTAKSLREDSFPPAGCSILILSGGIQKPKRLRREVVRALLIHCRRVGLYGNSLRNSVDSTGNLELHGLALKLLYNLDVAFW